MAVNSKPRSSWFAVVLVIAAVAIWAYHEGQLPAKPTAPTGNERSIPTTGNSEDIGKTGGYETYRNCTLTEARNNDGDSFVVRLPDGRKSEFRLYFVDAPESAFKRYPGGETNHARIREQAAEMGGITPEQAVEIGKKGKAFTLGLLASRPFTLHTEWDNPFNDNRFHAHVEVIQDGNTRWLHQVLLERGLARLKTKGASLPDGTSTAKEKDHLRILERAAKRAEVGAWRLK
jgi:endonuclease YncB( thermonuclease family)